MARITKSARPCVSEANAVPIAKPSGRLCTSNTPKTSSERVTPAPRSSPTWTSRPRSSRRETSRKATPVTRPPITEPPPSSSRAGSSSPTTEATPISPTAVPHRNGRSRSARAPSRKTGIVPRPVASAVALPASARAATSTRRALALDQVVVERVADQLGAARHAELLLDVGPMRLDGAHAEVEPARDLAVGVAERDQTEHVELALGQVAGRAARGGRHARSELGVEPGAAAGGGPDRLDELGAGRLLQHVALGAGPQRFAGKGGVLLHRQ